jgi:hypothetical protein
MKALFSILILFPFLAGFNVAAQQPDSLSVGNAWGGSADVNFYFMKDDFFVLPVFRADKGWLHLEGRYNYESEGTFSVWGGYNISGGNKFEYLFTPMVGFVAGDIVGVAPGLEMTLGFHGFELYSESEYFIAPDNPGNDFFYAWTDLTWSPLDWLWVGISGQRTRLFETDVEIQHGLILGGGYRDWELSGYLYNPGSDDLFFITTVSWSF